MSDMVDIAKGTTMDARKGCAQMEVNLICSYVVVDMCVNSGRDSFEVWLPEYAGAWPPLRYY